MKHLTKFETVADYNSAKNGLSLPNVSLINASNKVEYNSLNTSN